jgi:hypothetical protein
MRLSSKYGGVSFCFIILYCTKQSLQVTDTEIKQSNISVRIKASTHTKSQPAEQATFHYVWIVEMLQEEADH